MKGIPILVGVGFFPGLPIQIPYSPGVEHWWDIFWWAFQIAAMSFLLIYFRRSADRVDAEFHPGRRGHEEAPKKHP
ncbi:MAG: hypothetical protein OWU33_03400 [Firmicutes bacterium]|nr:hypothetical protein [Bacillota bacterium]